MQTEKVQFHTLPRFSFGMSKGISAMTAKSKNQKSAQRNLTKSNLGEFYNELEKAIVANGGAAVYPQKPFKALGYKVFLCDASKLDYGIQRPLDAQEIQIISDFIGIPFNGSKGALDILRQTLVKKCNVQNPDNYTWDNILACIAVHLLDDKTPPAGDTQKTDDIVARWSKPLSKTKIGEALGIDSRRSIEYIFKNMTTKKLNRKSCRVRLDLLNAREREKLEKA